MEAEPLEVIELNYKKPAIVLKTIDDIVKTFGVPVRYPHWRWDAAYEELYVNKNAPAGGR